ncbi:DUF3324 domain-containing protein [Lacticaseibacillus absianus]|uniref:DUF3324 domain-containing protein n=1 Tax=Lacticaseibacillus absianus TaxID=2729623 RepID=UPI0015CB15EB|nr:DUF3324 domain-containing protein [Lacticaseibacillus absianus]
MKILRFVLGFLALMLGLSLTHHQLVRAEGAGFSVAPLIGSDQLNTVTDYFNLVATPGRARDLQVQIDNTSDQAKTFTVTLTNAASQANGEIGYEPGTKLDASLKQPLSSLSSKPEQEVKVPAGQSQIVTIPLQIPAGGFTGVKLGGIYVLDQSVSAAESGDSGISLNNQFAMIIGVQLQTDENAVVTTKPDLRLGQVSAGTIDSSGGVIVNLRNVAPIFVDGMTATVKVTRKGDEKPTLTRTVKDWSMAPNSSLPLTVNTTKELKAEDYDVTVVAKAGGKTWNFTESFSIKAKEAAKVNKALGLTPTPAPPSTWIWYLVGGLGAVIVLLVGGMIWWWRRNRTPAATA